MLKQSVLGLAVLTATCGAMAQSSVMIWGVVDARIAHGTGNGVGSASRTQLATDGYNSSRLGFRGTEDLGGGMSASFWLEASVANDDGQGGGTNTNNQASGTGPAVPGRQGLTFNRRSMISLAGGWGEVRLGRDYTPQFWNLTVFDPFGVNGVGTSQNFAGIITGPTAVRSSNGIGYVLPANLGGFYGQAQYHMGENLQNGAVTEDDGTGYGFRIGYMKGPFNAALGVGRTNSATGDIRQSNVGAQWDFGVAKLMGMYSRDRNGSASAKGYLVGALVPVGTGEVRVALSEYKIDAGPGADPSTRKLALGYVHNLSKRTALYGTFARARNRDGAAVALNGAATAANSSSNGFDLGVKHSF